MKHPPGAPMLEWAAEPPNVGDGCPAFSPTLEEQPPQPFYKTHAWCFLLLLDDSANPLGDGISVATQNKPIVLRVVLSLVL